MNLGHPPDSFVDETGDGSVDQWSVALCTARLPRVGAEAGSATLRAEYARNGLEEAELETDPITMFERWFDEAVAAGLHDANAMVVATISAAGRPSVRMVLLKGLYDAGCVFFTNTASHKGIEAGRQPALCAALPVARAGAPGPRRRLDDAAVTAECRRTSTSARAAPSSALGLPQSRPVDRA